MTVVSQSAHRPWSSLRFGLGLIALLASLPWGAAPALAEGDDPAAQARWAELRAALFGDRPVADGAGLIGLETPYRAEDAAVVPVAVKSLMDPAAGHFIKDLYLIIDMNPVPLAATFHFPGPAAWDRLATRVRVNAYTNVRAVAQTDDGRLFTVANFVKAAGGCSAPSLKDPAAAAAQLGRMKLVLPEQLKPGARLTAQLMIKHPNSSGLQFDQVARQFIPADYIQRIDLAYQGQPLFSVDSNISISEDPSIRFGLVPAAAGDLRVQVKDSAGRRFEQTFPIAVTGGG